MALSLSTSDVQRLSAAKADAGIRAETVSKVAHGFKTGNLTSAERRLAEDIFRSMAEDVEARVRKAMAESLRDSDEVPHDLGVRLANDVSEVAVPFIEMTSVLTDEDLLQIIQTHGQEYQVAVAKRPHVSERVSDALVDTKNETVVATLVNNAGAQISEKTMSRVLDDFGHIRPIATSMAGRNALPLTIAERLVTLVSEKMQGTLRQKAGMNESVAARVRREAQEKATVSLLDGAQDAPDIHSLVNQLYKSKRLTHTLVVRALCMGDVVFFETALARLANVPVSNVYQLVHNKGTRGIERLFQKLDVNPKLLEVALVALELASDMKLDGRDDREQFRAVMLDRVLTKLGETQDVDSIDFLMRKMSAPGKAA